MALEIIILAAGKGTRMRSALPKVLHPLAGQPLIAHVLACARGLRADRVTVVHGHGADAVRDAVDDGAMRWVHQAEQLGTGHAVRLALDGVSGDADDTVLVMYGDVPLIEAHTLASLSAAAAGALALLTLELADPGRYGRILRDDDGAVTGIVEAADANPEQLAIGEINTGFMAAPRSLMTAWLSRLRNDNAQGEYYLTDIAGLAVADGVAVRAVQAGDELEVRGVNSRVELAAMERAWQRRLAEALMHAGTSVADPSRLDVRGRLSAGIDGFIDVNVVFEGNVELGDRVRIGPGCVIRDAVLGDDVVVHAHSVIEGARIAGRCSIGPFARVRPGTSLDEGARLGNFVETKQAAVGAGSKINHLAYVGDCEIGREANIGAGVITCNYDGVNKHRTVIGDGAFIGSDCQLVAPVTIGENATVGAGTTLTRDAPANQLTVGRSPQRSLAHWRRPARKPG